jgi:hypothetical protein
MKFDLPTSGPKSDQFIKLASGDSIVGVFRGEPFKFPVHWVGRRSSVCPQVGCALCAGGDKAKWRFRLNMAVLESGKWVSRVFEQGMRVYRNLGQIDAKVAPLDSSQVKITRLGAGSEDTTYNVMVTGTVTPAAHEAISRLPLIPLGDASEDGDEAALEGDAS